MPTLATPVTAVVRPAAVTPLRDPKTTAATITREQERLRTANILAVARTGGVSYRAGQIGLTRGQLADAARYTAQALYGGYDVRRGGYFTGAFDREGRLVNPALMPNVMSPAIAWAMGLSEDDRVSMGYSPKYPYNLLNPPPGAGGGAAGGGGDGGIGGDGGGGRGFDGGGGFGGGNTLPLTMWRL